MFRQHTFSLVIGLVLWCALLSPTRAAGTGISFSLIDHHGDPFHLQQLRGKIVLVFFGYTLCPDVCPIELQYMASALNQLGKDAKHAQGLFITVDPEHDRPEVLARYMEYFGAGMLGLTGTKPQIDRVARQFKVTYRKKSRAGNLYTLDHSANLFVIDKNGALSSMVPFGFPPGHIESLLTAMVAADS